ncbi:hypothetical protein PLCT2_01548 [Planctomycetaceae bacterium]|nr:hypothetical protein PLCT2_01548 [Planctomycetaceae bacterium]
MLTSLVEKLSRRLADVRDFLAYVQAVSEFLEPTESRAQDSVFIKHATLFHRAHPVIPRMRYGSAIVATYGALEQFVVNAIEAYVKAVRASCEEYEQLPDTIRESHNTKCASYASVILGQRRDVRLTLPELVKRWSGCIGKVQGYELNYEVFSHHTANFRHSLIDEIFSEVGVGGLSKSCLRIDEFRAHVVTSTGISDIENRPLADLMATVDDLANRRNDVAHGVDGDVLDMTTLMPVVDFVERYCVAIAAVLSSQIASIRAITIGAELGKPLVVYNKSIPCFRVVGGSLSEGDWIAARHADSDDHWSYGTVQEIQIEGQRLPRIRVKKPIAVALRVDFHAKENQLFFVDKRKFSL